MRNGNVERMVRQLYQITVIHRQPINLTGTKSALNRAPQRARMPAASSAQAGAACAHLSENGVNVIPMTIDDAACVSFRAQRRVIPSAATGHSERSEESARVARDPSRCSG
jgi:hypothetical protein